jgi:hypothetical protein
MSGWVWLLVFHPIPVTILVFGLAFWFLTARDHWMRYGRIIFVGACATYVIDTAFALPRIAYAWRSPDHAVVNERVALPARLVLAFAECDRACHERLFSGALDEVILVRSNAPGRDPQQPLRYRVSWTEPNNCPNERRRLIPYHQYEKAQRGFCPAIEPIELPTDGIFVVQDHFHVASNQHAASFKSVQLTSSPPGAIIEFTGVEVQRRTQGRIEVLASRRKVTAPGLTGLPPLLGCWDRPDNVIWIMPAGDTKCGFWRWFTSGGDVRWQGDSDWVFAEAFAPPDRPFAPLSSRP